MEGIIVLRWLGPAHAEGLGPELPLPPRNLTYGDLEERGITVEQAVASGHYEFMNPLRGPAEEGTES